MKGSNSVELQSTPSIYQDSQRSFDACRTDADYESFDCLDVLIATHSLLPEMFRELFLTVLQASSRPQKLHPLNLPPYIPKSHSAVEYTHYGHGPSEQGTNQSRTTVRQQGPSHKYETTIELI